MTTKQHRRLSQALSKLSIARRLTKEAESEIRLAMKQIEAEAKALKRSQAVE